MVDDDHARGSSREPRVARLAHRSGRAPLLTRVPDGPARARRPMARAILRSQRHYSADPPSRVRPRLLDDLDQRRVATHCHEPTCAGEAAAATQRPRRVGHALSDSVDREGGEVARGAGDHGNIPHPVVPSLRDVELRVGGRAGAGHRATRSSWHDARNHASLLRSPGLHQRAGGHSERRPRRPI